MAHGSGVRHRNISVAHALGGAPQNLALFCGAWAVRHGNNIFVAIFSGAPTMRHRKAFWCATKRPFPSSVSSKSMVAKTGIP